MENTNSTSQPTCFKKNRHAGLSLPKDSMKMNPAACHKTGVNKIKARLRVKSRGIKKC